MADKSVGELIAAQSVTPTDLFVLEQNGTAKKLTGQILENWLVSFADGHGGIQSIAKVGTSNLADTYRITLADTTIFDFVVTNGRGITSISKTKTSGLVDTYTIKFNDNTSGTFNVTNGAKGDKGDNQYVWIKYASQKPTASSHSFGDVADNWIGIYSGGSATAPTDWTQYEWFQIKGEKGNTGSPATLTSSKVEYQVSNSGTIIPSGAWSGSVPVVAQGKYMWTRTTNTFNTGNPVVSYSVARMGLDGAGSVSSVAGISPNSEGNVPLKATDIGALPSNGGDMTGELKMNGQPISGLNAPTANDHAANMGFVNQQVSKAAPKNLLDNSDFTNPVNQRGNTKYIGTGYGIDRWYSRSATINIEIVSNGIKFSNTGTARSSVDQTIDRPDLIGKPLTLVVEFADGSIKSGCVTIGSTDGWNAIVSWITPNASYIGLLNNGGRPAARLGVAGGENFTIKRLAVYEGEYNAAIMPEYQPKGYAAEKLECQRYYVQFALNQSGNTIPMMAVTATQTYGFIPLPTKMRVVPTITASGVVLRQGSTDVAATDVAVSGGLYETGMVINANVASSLTKGDFYVLRVSDGSISLSADL